MKKQYVPKILAQVKVCGEKDTFCAHPREGGDIYYFGNNELAFFHLHTEDVEYDGDTVIDHGLAGIHGKSKVVLTRSYDGGMTWKEEDRSVVFDNGLPVEEQLAMLANRMTEDSVEPVTEQTIFNWVRCFYGPLMKDGVSRQTTSFVIRSEDKGHTWSQQVAVPDNLGFTFMEAGGPAVRQGDRWLQSFQVSTVPDLDNYKQVVGLRSVLYSSEDNGVTWRYVSDIARDEWNECSYCYVTVLDLGEGHLFATTGVLRDPYQDTRWICSCDSYDNGLNWTKPRRIQSFGISPYSLRLQDGRILIVYARRDPVSTRGIYGIISGDDGQTWSEEFVLRQGASGKDIGYPVAVQMDNGNIFTGYYYMEDDGQARGGARYIGGTIFTV